MPKAEKRAAIGQTCHDCVPAAPCMGPRLLGERFKQGRVLAGAPPRGAEHHARWPAGHLARRAVGGIGSRKHPFAQSFDVDLVRGPLQIGAVGLTQRRKPEGQSNSCVGGRDDVAQLSLFAPGLRPGWGRGGFGGAVLAVPLGRSTKLRGSALVVGGGSPPRGQVVPVESAYRTSPRTRISKPASLNTLSRMLDIYAPPKFRQCEVRNN